MKKQRKNVFEPMPLHNAEESNILGAMMTNNVFMLWCFKYHVSEECFEGEDSKILFKVIESLKQKREPIDLLTVSEGLRMIGKIDVIPPIVLANAIKNPDVKRAYTSMKKRIKVYELDSPVYDLSENIRNRKKEEYKTVINFDENKEFRYFCERFKMWVNSGDITVFLQRLASPDTSVNDRQFCAGVLYAVRKFENVFDAFLENEDGDLLGITLSDLVNQYDSWKKGDIKRIQEKSKAIDDEVFRIFPNDDIPF